MMLVAIVAALAAASLFATATAALHRSAGIVVEDSGSELGRFVLGTARNPLWLLGMLGELFGFGLHAVALREGPLTLVQPLLVTGVVFALPIRQLIEGRRPGRAELVWAAALALGLGVFFVAATPGEGPGAQPDRVPTIVAIAGMSAGIAICGVVGRRADNAWSAAVLAAGAGLAFAGVAGLLKEATTEVSQGVVALVTHWPVYALAVVGICGLLLSQLAFRAAPLRASLPALTTVDPLTSLVIGVVVFDEPFRRTPLALGAEVAGLALVIAAVVALTRREPVTA
ncbi:MAG: DMT family transporter [Acidimicrobiales bacterium]